MAPIMDGEMGFPPKFWAEEEVRGETEPVTGCCKAAIGPAALEYMLETAMEVGEAADMNCEAAMGEVP